MTGCLITAYVQRWARNAYSYAILEVSVWLFNAFGKMIIDSSNFTAIATYSFGEFFVANAMAFSLIALWSRARRKSGLSLDQPLLLDEIHLVMPFIVLSLLLSALVAVVRSYPSGLGLSGFLDWFASQSVGLVVTLPAVLLVSQTDWRHRSNFTWTRMLIATILTVAVITIPIAVSFVYETPLLTVRPATFKVFWAVLFTVPVLALSGVLLGTTGLALHLLLFSIATPMIRFLPGDFEYDDHLLAMMILLIDLSMIPFFVLLADRNRFLGSVEKQVQERTIELVKANQEKTEFMSFLCHELRNPLHVVLSMADMTMTENPNNEYAKASITAARYMADLCNDVLDATKLKSGKTSIEPHWGDLATMLNEQCHSFALHAATLGINLEYHCDATVPDKLYTDNLRWRQCLTNLLANACRFTKSGGRVDVSLYLIKDGTIPLDHVRLRCEVADTGIGIDPSHIPTLFAPFSIASQQTTREYQGSGLGLSLSAMLVELMGGKLQVESQPGHGTRFWFELIVRRETSSQTPHTSIGMEGMDLGTPRVAMIEMNSVSGHHCNHTAGTCHCHQASGTSVCTHHTSSTGACGVHRLAILPKSQNNSREGLADDDTIVDIHPVKRTNSEPTAVVPFTTTKQPDQPTMSQTSPLGLMMSNDIGTHMRGRDRNESNSFVMSDQVADNVPATIPNDFTQEITPTQPESNTFEHIIGALVVDDSDVNRALLKRMLNRLKPDMELHMANDGQEAIDLAEQHKYRIIFMDLQMPRVDGWQAISHIRKAGLNIDTPIVITSANTVLVEEDTIRQCGVLPKPFLVKDLKSALDKYI
ncbi:hypothetical protein SmJEL517_g01007 [Synchytrium microbalum]|uniref:Histidine kinase n=1 Tax=Synchytrium microbalum TaxID=1806994 RepID=A0A507CG89_9FUNG|nr:uncharacterized protein SmJEL517_g01007 [Synchytrium microbalum]TPX36964.1 hypothetical protein SmJEL517_g01007 [Synchytrium microbalum]